RYMDRHGQLPTRHFGEAIMAPMEPHLCFCHSDLEFSIPGACHFSVGDFWKSHAQTQTKASHGPPGPSSPIARTHAPLLFGSVPACHSPSNRRRFALYREARKDSESQAVLVLS